MSPELEALLRNIILILYEQNQEDDDESYWDLADELSAIIIETRGDDEE
jgi:hypothetical protein